MDKLVTAGLVDASWGSGEYKGIVTDSVATLIVRKGNPTEHHDLGRPDQAGREGRHPQPAELG